MAPDEADDPTEPTGRAGVDPLLAHPTTSTGLTGQIERPGDQTPWWFVPGLCAVAVFFIGLLATINQDRAADRIAAEEAGNRADSGSALTPVLGADEETSGDVDTADVTAPGDPLLADLPPPGTVLFAGDPFPIVSRCEVQLPFDPVDTDYQVSSYLFFDADGERRLIDRIFDGQSERALLLGDTRFVSVDDIGDSGAFVATFDDADNQRFDVTVNPSSDTDARCADRVVVNEPGQFAEPHTRIILDVCIDRTTDSFSSIVGVASEGTRFEILQAGGELGEIVFVENGQEPKRTTAPASIIRSGDITSASGVVNRGADVLDITIDFGNDVTEADARECTASDRL